jgi:hypothetical protein
LQYGNNLKAKDEQKLATLTWTTFDSDGSLFSRGKRDYYTILIRGVPPERPKDCIIELYVTDKEMTLSEITYNIQREKVQLLSRQIVLGNLLPVTNMSKAIDEMRETAERRENEIQVNSISSAFTSK